MPERKETPGSVYVCVRAPTHVCACVCACMCVCMHVCIHACVYACMFVCIHVCECVCLCASHPLLPSLPTWLRKAPFPH